MKNKVPFGLDINKTLIAAVDISMRTNTGYLRFNGRDLVTTRFSNNRIGFNKFFQVILKFQQECKPSRTVVGFESTGAYGIPFIHFFKDKPFELFQVNPMHTHKLKEITDNSPNKTDDKDPKVIADIIELRRYLKVVIPTGIAAELRSLSNSREQLIEHRNAMCNQLRDLVFIVFPEFVHLFKNVTSATASKILSEYTFPEAVLALGRIGIINFVRKTSRGKIPETKATALYEAAKDSAGIKEGHLGYRESIKMYLEIISKLDHHIQKLESKIGLLVSEVPESQYLLSIKGLGSVTVGGLLGEFADFRLFRTSDEVLKYAGLNLYEISSGEHNGRRRISKKGRPLIRKFLYFAVLNMIRNNGAFRDAYQHHLKKYKTYKNRAVIAVVRKLLRTIFALVKKEQLFIKDQDRLLVAA